MNYRNNGELPQINQSNSFDIDPQIRHGEPIRDILSGLAYFCFVPGSFAARRKRLVESKEIEDTLLGESGVRMAESVRALIYAGSTLGLGVLAYKELS